MGFQRELHVLAQREDLSPHDALMGFARILLFKASEDPSSVSEESIAACVQGLSKMQQGGSTDESDWSDIASFAACADVPPSARLGEEKGNTT